MVVQFTNIFQIVMKSIVKKYFWGIDVYIAFCNSHSFVLNNYDPICKYDNKALILQKKKL